MHLVFGFLFPLRQNECNQIQDEVVAVVKKVVTACLSPALQAICSGGFTRSAVEDALLDIISYKLVQHKPLEEVVTVAVKTLFSKVGCGSCRCAAASAKIIVRQATMVPVPLYSWCCFLRSVLCFATGAWSASRSLCTVIHDENAGEARPCCHRSATP